MSMPLEKAALPRAERDLLVTLFHAIVRAARAHVASWDDLKTLLANGAALAVQEQAGRRGESLAQAAERLQVDVTTLRRNLPPPPRPESVRARLEREVFQAVDREGRVSMSELEALLASSQVVALARRSRPRLEVADAVVALVEAGHLERIERDRLPTQYAVARTGGVLLQKGQSRDDWMDGLGFALTLVMDAAIKQSQEVNSEAFARKMRRAQQQGEAMPVPARERMPWFFVQRPSTMDEHEINERFTAAIRDVIESLERERPEGDRGELMHLCLALNHSYDPDSETAALPRDKDA